MASKIHQEKVKEIMESLMKRGFIKIKHREKLGCYPDIILTRKRDGLFDEIDEVILVEVVETNFTGFPTKDKILSCFDDPERVLIQMYLVTKGGTYIVNRTEDIG